MQTLSEDSPGLHVHELEPGTQDGLAQLLERLTQDANDGFYDPSLNPVRSTRKMCVFPSQKRADSLSVCPNPRVYKHE